MNRLKELGQDSAAHVIDASLGKPKLQIKGLEHQIRSCLDTQIKFQHSIDLQSWAEEDIKQESYQIKRETIITSLPLLSDDTHDCTDVEEKTDLKLGPELHAKSLPSGLLIKRKPVEHKSELLISIPKTSSSHPEIDWRA